MASLDLQQRWPRTGRLVAALACVPLVLLAGCPQSTTAAPGKATAQQTAPAAAAPATVAVPGASSAITQSAASVEVAKALKTQQLIDRVQATYQSGVNNYRAQHLDAARMDFDSAVDLMLTSGLDLKGDPQLSEQFEQLVDAVNSLELQALKVGNGFSPPVEAAPVDDLAESTFSPASAADTAALKASLNTASDLPLVINPTVAGYINAYSNSSGFRAHMRASLQRLGKYKDMMLKILKDEGVPQDFIYLAVAESGFQPQVVNAKSGAGGMWQFMPSASSYGLVRNGYFDERFDPEKSTRAYARYLKACYAQFNDWYLAMAGYDWGPGNVQKAVMRTGYADYWELARHNALPGETKNYVPQILAAIIMTKNPERYGLDKLKLEAPVVYDTVTTDYAIDLRLVADVTGASVPEIVALNPSLLRLQTPRDISFDMHIPVGTKDLYAKRLHDIPETKRTSWRFHVVKPGETVDSIATALHAHADDINEENEIAKSDTLEEGDELVIPMASVVASSGGTGSSVRSQHYTVRRGDTLVTIADRFDVSIEDLRTWNHLRSNSVDAGHALVVSEPVRLAPATRVRSRRGSSGAAKSSASTRSSRGAKQPATRGSATSKKASAPSAKSASTSNKKTQKHR